MRRTMAVVLLLVLILAAFALPGTPAFAADGDSEPIEVCYVVIHIHVFPAVDLTPPTIGVETGEYHPHQNCVVIDPIS